jgi:hypothetical protein
MRKNEELPVTNNSKDFGRNWLIKSLESSLSSVSRIFFIEIAADEQGLYSLQRANYL